MAGFFDQYETKSSLRERVAKWFFVAIVAVLLLWGLDWTLAKLGKDNLTDFRAQWRARSFVKALEAKSYEEAYSMWGCTKATPCRDYAYEKFMEDWGPNSPNAGLVNGEKLVTRHCATGIIRTDLLPNKEMVHLYVDRRDLNISFAPWGDSCSAPTMKAP